MQMKTPLKRWRLRVTPLTPVHVGSGETIEPYQYLLHEGEIWVLDPAALVESLPSEATERYLEALAEGPLHARETLLGIADRYDLSKAVVWQGKAGVQLENHLKDALNAGRGELGIRLFPRSLRGPYLPGSSLKGAIRTAFIFGRTQEELEADFDNEEGEWVGQYDYVYRKMDSDHKTRRAFFDWAKTPGRGRIRLLERPIKNNKRKAMEASQRYEAHLLHHWGARREGNREPPPLDITRDPFRALSVADSGPIAKTEFRLVKVFGSKKVGKEDEPTGIAIPTEVWNSGSTEVTITFYKALATDRRSPLYVIRNRKGVVLGREPTKVPTLEAIAESAYDRYAMLADNERLEYELRSWSVAARAMDRVVEAIESCLDDEGALRKPLRFPLRLGFGSGSLTLRLAEFLMYEDTGRVKPVSRRLAEDLPMGWVLVEVIEG